MVMLSRRSILGASAMVTVSTLRVIIQIAILPIIGRILGPQAYGQIALVSPFIYFSMLFTEAGLGLCIIRAEKTSDDLEGTVFCYSVACSLLVIACFAAVGQPIGYLLGDPVFPYLLMAMSSILLIAAFTVVPAALLTRAKKYEWLALSDALPFMVSIGVVSIGLVSNWGVWSLVAQQVSLWVCKCAVLMIGARYWPRLTFHWLTLKENFHFGASITGATFLGFVARNIDNILIGFFLGSEKLGFYALAFQLICMPQMVLSGPVSSVMLAGTSEAKRSGESVRPLLSNVLRLSMLISAPVLVGLAVTAPISVPLFLGDKWIPMIMILTFLLPFGIIQTPAIASVNLLSGLGQGVAILRQTIMSVSLILVGITGGVLFGSPNAVAVGVSFAALINSYLLLGLVEVHSGVKRLAIYTLLAPSLIASIGMGCGVVILQTFTLNSLPPFGALCVSVMFGASLYCAILAGVFKENIIIDVYKARLLLRRKKPNT